MTTSRLYTDDDLRVAVQQSHSWRGVLRALGLSGSSAGAIRTVRRRAAQLELDWGHFTGQRCWTGAQLGAVVAVARSWDEVSEQLGAPRAPTATLRGHAARLGLDVGHLDAPSTSVSWQHLRPDARHLRRAGSMLAATWFMSCGCEVAWPLEPCRYDLLVTNGDEVHRVQVKTATRRTGSSWTVWLSTTSGARRTTYTPDEIDDFFVVDGSGDLYLIPLSVVGGLHAITLSAYADFRVPPLTGGAVRHDGTTL